VKKLEVLKMVIAFAFVVLATYITGYIVTEMAVHEMYGPVILLVIIPVVVLTKIYFMYDE